MHRKYFLQGLGLLGLSSVVPFNKTKPGVNTLNKSIASGEVDCILIPHETAGPYPLDLSGDDTYFRVDVTEGKPGMQLDLTLTVVNINDNCSPVANARIDIWHTDKDGVYSGYVQPGVDTTGQTFCRGIQITDVYGKVNFKTIYPGWYPGRITHIHFEVFLSSVLNATSQMAFPDDITTLVYNSSLYIDRGQNTSVANNASDSVFATPAGDLEYEILTLTPNASTGGYNGTFTIGIDAPVTGLINIEPETGGQFKLLPNHPNPFNEETTISFILNYAANVKIEIYDLKGLKIAEVLNKKMQPGEQNIVVKKQIGNILLTPGNYAYQLTTENSNGIFRQVKVMTVK